MKNNDCASFGHAWFKRPSIPEVAFPKWATWFVYCECERCGKGRLTLWDENGEECKHKYLPLGFYKGLQGHSRREHLFAQAKVIPGGKIIKREKWAVG